MIYNEIAGKHTCDSTSNEICINAARGYKPLKSMIYVFNQVIYHNVISEKKMKKPQLSTIKSVHVYGTLGMFLRQAEC